MLTRRVLRGVIAYRQIAATPKQLKLRSVPWHIQSRFYSDAAGGGGNGAGGGGGNNNNNNNNNNTKSEKPANNNGKTEPETPTPEQTIEKLKKELDEAKQEILLAYADRQNSIRIAKDDVRKAKEYGIQKFATALLDVNDILERALESVTKEKLGSNPDLQNFYEGVKMTERLILKVYEQSDVKRFSPLGEKFDPNRHQALQELPDPSKEPGTITYVMKAGYQLKDRLLRPASVVVVKDRPKEAPKETPKEESKDEKKEEPVASS